MTGRDLVTASLRLIGAIAPGESVAASEATDGLASLNRMIASWSAEELMIPSVTPEAPLTLTPGTGSYTLGSGGDITTRPQRIEKALLRDETQSPAIEIPINLLSLDEWTRIAQKGLQSTYPRDLYDAGGYPLRTINLYPVPSFAHKLVLFTSRPLSRFETLDSEISVPLEYEEPIIYNLGIRLAPEYGRVVSAEIADIARESKANVKRMNYRTEYLRCDPAVVSTGNYNIYTGGSSR